MQPPEIYYIGDKYQKRLLEKICIDWSTRKIRGSVYVLEPEKVKKFHNKVYVEWFSFDDLGVEISFTPNLLGGMGK